MASGVFREQWRKTSLAAMANYIDAGSIVAGAVSLPLWAKQFGFGDDSPCRIRRAQARIDPSPPPRAMARALPAASEGRIPSTPTRVAARAQRQGRPSARDRNGHLAWEQLRPWLAARVDLPVGPLFCVIDGPTRGRPWSSANARVEFRRLAAQAGIRRRFAPRQLRHAHAVELAREGVPLNVIQRQLGHANLGTTSIYLQGIDTEEIIATVHARRAPMMSASAGLQL
jgi:hypothetical protein